MLSEHHHTPSFDHYKGRPYWKVLRGFVLDLDFQPCAWCHLSKEAQAIYPVMQIFSCNGHCDAINQAIGHFSRSSGSRSQVSKGIKNLRDEELLDIIRCPRCTGAFSHNKKILSSLGNGQGSFAIFQREIITDRIWASLGSAGKSVLFVCLQGVRINAMKEFVLFAQSEEGRRIFPSDWYDENEYFCWKRFMTAIWGEDEKKRFAKYLPFISLFGEDQFYLGYPTLAKFSGLDVKSARSATHQLETKRLLLVFDPPSGTNIAHRFLLPPITCPHCKAKSSATSSFKHLSRY